MTEWTAFASTFVSSAHFEVFTNHCANVYGGRLIWLILVRELPQNNQCLWSYDTISGQTSIPSSVTQIVSPQSNFQKDGHINFPY